MRDAPFRSLASAVTMWYSNGDRSYFTIQKTLIAVAFLSAFSSYSVVQAGLPDGGSMSLHLKPDDISFFDLKTTNVKFFTRRLQTVAAYEGDTRMCEKLEVSVGSLSNHSEC